MAEPWIDADGWNDGPSPEPQPTPGQRHVTVICCPACSSLSIARYSTAGELSYWRCSACAENWKLPAKAGRERGYLL